MSRAKRKKPAAIGISAPFPSFIEPGLAISMEVEYRATSVEGKVRRPFFKGLRRTCDG